MKLLLRVLLITGFALTGFVVSARTSTPEQYGAVGDGITDDTESILAALAENESVVLNGTYKVGYLVIPRGRQFVAKDSAVLLYFAVDVMDDCTVKGIVFDGQWHTRGVQILGSNVVINGCSFINTKGTLDYFGGLTSALWVGRYQDLDEKAIKYHKVTVSNCDFSDCEPYDSSTQVSNNTTVARFILSYGCENLKISSCSFSGLKGTYDSDAIQLCSYSIAREDFPFSCINDSWRGSNAPYLGICYAPCRTYVEKCSFEQATSKSSIKIMSSDVRVLRNEFILLNDSLRNPCYSIVRVHFAKDVMIKNNLFTLTESASDSVVKIGNSLDVEVENNIFISKDRENNPPAIFDISYSSHAVVKKNQIQYEKMEGLMVLEYNNNLEIRRNTFYITQIETDVLKLAASLSNHYSYPPPTYTASRFEGNRFNIGRWTGETIDISNKYDFPLSYRFNRIRINEDSVNTQIKE